MKIQLDNQPEQSLESGEIFSDGSFAVGLASARSPVLCWHPTQHVFALASRKAETDPELHRISVRYGGECGVEIWRVSPSVNPSRIDTIRLEGSCVYDLAFSPSGDMLAAATSQGDICVIHLDLASNQGASVDHLRSEDASLVQWRVRWHPSRDQLLVGCTNGSIIMWQLSSRKKWISTAHSAAVRCLQFREDGAFFVSGGHDGRVKLWNPLDPLTPIIEEKLGLVCLTAIDFVHDMHLAVGADDGVIRIVSFNIAQGRTTSSTVTCHAGAVWDLRVMKRSPAENSEIFSCGADGIVSSFLVGETVHFRGVKRRGAPKRPIQLMALTTSPGTAVHIDSEDASEPKFFLTRTLKGVQLGDLPTQGKHNRKWTKLPLAESQAWSGIRIFAGPSDLHRLFAVYGAQGLFVLFKLKPIQRDGGARGAGKHRRSGASKPDDKAGADPEASNQAEARSEDKEARSEDKEDIIKSDEPGPSNLATASSADTPHATVGAAPEKFVIDTESLDKQISPASVEPATSKHARSSPDDKQGVAGDLEFEPSRRAEENSGPSGEVAASIEPGSSGQGKQSSDTGNPGRNSEPAPASSSNGSTSLRNEGDPPTTVEAVQSGPEAGSDREDSTMTRRLRPRKQGRRSKQPKLGSE